MAAVEYEFSPDYITQESEESKPLTDEEKETLDKMCEAVGADRAMTIAHECKVRFVRGYAFEKKNGKWLQVATAEFEKLLQWRKEVDADTLLTRELPKSDLFMKAWPTCVAGVDRLGHPIIVERFADWDLDSLIKDFNDQDLTLLQARNLERVQAIKAKITEKTGRLTYKHCYVLDLNGLSSKLYSAKDQAKAIFHVAQYYYPETLYKMFLLNSPFLFRAIWKVASPMVHPITRDKMKILGGSYLDELKTHGIEADQLPPSIKGGTWKA